jgi:hypothetical protein
MATTPRMLWWDWNSRQRLGVIGAILFLAALPSLYLCWGPKAWGAFLPATGFIALPLLFAWHLFVGVRTGRMQSGTGVSELRAKNPGWFWLTGALYTAVLLQFLWIVAGVVWGKAVWGF